METIYFTERQHGRWSYYMLSGALIFLSLSYFLQWGTRPMPLTGYLILSFTFMGLFLLFCRMDTVIDSTAIRIRYGLFGFSKVIPLACVQDVRSIKYPYYYGVGIRFIPQGTLYSVNFSKAVEITLRDEARTFSIGTERSEELIATIQRLVNKHS